MQRAQNPLFVQRSIFYTCRLVSKSLKRGDYYDIPTILTLCITDKTLPEFADLDGFFHLVQLRRVDGKNISEKIILGYLDLSKFATLNPGQIKKTCNSLINRRNGALRWPMSGGWSCRICRRRTRSFAVCSRTACTKS